LRRAGVDATTLLRAGFTVAELRNGGFAESDLLEKK